jgi:hypothetical protein
MKKLLAVGLVVLSVLATSIRSNAIPVEKDRYRVEFSGTEGKRLKASISWSTSNDLKSRYNTEDISRQVPIAFEIDLPLGSSIIAAGSIPGEDPISIKIFINGFQCDDARGIKPSNSAVRSCHP